LIVDIEHIGDRSMITHSPISGQRNLAVLLTIVVAASFCFSAACTPAPVQSKSHRVHTAAASLVLM
jgi:hypothetical protein